MKFINVNEKIKMIMIFKRINLMFILIIMATCLLIISNLFDNNDFFDILCNRITTLFYVIMYFITLLLLCDTIFLTNKRYKKQMYLVKYNEITLMKGLIINKSINIQYRNINNMQIKKDIIYHKYQLVRLYIFISSKKICFDGITMEEAQKIIGLVNYKGERHEI